MPRSIKEGICRGITVQYGDLSSSAIGGTDIKASSITYGKLASSAVGGTDIKASSVTYGKLATAAVGGTNILTASVTYGKLASNAVSNTNLVSALQNPVTGVAGGYKLARGAKTAGVATPLIATGLTTIVAFNLIDGARTATAANNCAAITGYISSANIQAYRWKHISAGTSTLVAATTAGTLYWEAVGT